MDNATRDNVTTGTKLECVRNPTGAFSKGRVWEVIGVSEDLVLVRCTNNDFNMTLTWGYIGAFGIVEDFKVGDRVKCHVSDKETIAYYFGRINDSYYVTLEEDADGPLHKATGLEKHVERVPWEQSDFPATAVWIKHKDLGYRHAIQGLGKERARINDMSYTYEELARIGVLLQEVEGKTVEIEMYKEA